MVDVVAGVIRDARGRVLLARRTEGRDLAGLWEFPGGKRRPGRDAEAGARPRAPRGTRHRHACGAPLIAVPQRYPHKRMRLDVRHIALWPASARPRRQALAWVAAASAAPTRCRRPTSPSSPR
jgi:8-oxo-dGTP diphosphatase